MRLDGKRAVITGSARGIGRAIAERMVAEGARVAITDRDGAAAVAAAAAIGPAATPIPADVVEPD